MRVGPIGWLLATWLVAVPAAAQDDAARQRLLEQGELQLAAGDAAAAEQAFDAAAAMRHEPDAELGLVRAYMQAGNFRRALGFAAHAAGAHRDEPQAVALYAWLLFLGGQEGVGKTLLDQALAASPQDSTLLRVRERIADLRTPQDGANARLATLLAPCATPTGVAAATHLAGSGVLAGGGRLALVPMALLDGARSLWLRNRLGQTVEARLERHDEVSGIAVLRLRSPLPWPANLRAAAREPFAGSPGAVLAYRPSDGPEPAWPVLRQGFFARLPANTGPRPLGIDAPRGPHGGPVFDHAGQLAGMASTAPDGSAMLVPAASVAALGELPLAVAAAERVAVDTLYEIGLRITLQLLVAR